LGGAREPVFELAASAVAREFSQLLEILFLLGTNMLRQLARAIVVFGFAGILVGCTGGGCSSRKDIPPEEQLHSYISKAVNVMKPLDRLELVELSAGGLKSSLVNMSDEAFKQAYIDRKYDFRTFEIIERRDISEKEVQIDFRIVYKSWRVGERTERAPTLDTKNRAFLIYEYGRWAISKVESLGSSFEWEVGLPLDDVKAEELKPGEEPKEIRSSREERAEHQMQQEQTTQSTQQQQ
jgi:hypothetical protein